MNKVFFLSVTLNNVIVARWRFGIEDIMYCVGEN